jgi:hypothetical protein
VDARSCARETAMCLSVCLREHQEDKHIQLCKYVYGYMFVPDRETEMRLFMLALALKTNRVLVVERCVHVCLCECMCVSVYVRYRCVLFICLWDRATWAPASCVSVCICLWPSLSINIYSSICVCLCVASFSLSVSLGVTDRLVGGPHASLDNNSIGAEGAKHVGAVLGKCPNLTHVRYVFRCPWADPSPPPPPLPSPPPTSLSRCACGC